MKHRQLIIAILLPLLAVLHAKAYDATGRYADHSVLAMGQWAKIRVEATGFYQLTDELLAQAGFDDPARVKVYGYGGARQPEKLTPDYLRSTDDLSEVPTTTVDGRRIFFATGPVNWNSATDEQRERNNYSSYGYYFLTENADAPLTLTPQQFAHNFYPLPHDYHALHEVENFSWFHGGRQLFEAEPLAVATDRSCRLASAGGNGVLTVGMVYSDYCDAEVLVGDSLVGHILVNEENTSTKSKERRPYLDKVNNHYSAMLDYWYFALDDLPADSITVTLRKLSGATMHPDYIALRTVKPRPMTDLSLAQLPVPEFVETVANQDHHADGPVDMVIIVPTNRQVEDEAKRLAAMHAACDGLTTRIVPANELYNEFSSGTPDANAYRRYLKMLYDRARTDSERPRYLLLFGDGAWDNRMLLSDWRSTDPDDFLLTFESDNSFSETQCYATDDYFCFLDDGEGGNLVVGDKADVAVGRMPARTAGEARVMVDKTISYRLNEQAGDWQNTICIMADDGNDNLHMQDAEYVVDSASIDQTAFRLKKIYWDAYTMTKTSKGNDYPDVRKIIREQMKQGALIMNYTGHGSAVRLSNEECVVLQDFEAAALGRLPLWFMAACDIMPFNTQENNIGEAALKNPTGGAVAVISTVHTVYAQLNRIQNKCLMRRLLGTGADGKSYAIGEALRLAKQAVFYERRIGNSSEGMPRNDRPNHLQYMLLGDPALKLNLPGAPIVVDRINGKSVDQGEQHLAAGSTVTVEGHVAGHPAFNGLASITVMDAKETVTGRVNNTEETKKAYSWKDRPYMIFNGTDSVSNGQFAFTFTLPKDISYSDSTGLFYIWATTDDHSLTAHGRNGQFTMGDGGMPWQQGEGPDVMCYLDNALFRDGDIVGQSPYFYAEVYDPDGINASGNGIGHDMELIIDGRLMTTYVLNSYFEYAVGDYTHGSVGYFIPALPEGEHTLLFRVWDVLNNSSVATLSFVVGGGPGQGPDTSGIREVNTSIADAPGRQVFDAAGRKCTGQQPSRRGVYICRDEKGTVKKLAAGRQ